MFTLFGRHGKVFLFVFVHICYPEEEEKRYERRLCSDVLFCMGDVL